MRIFKEGVREKLDAPRARAGERRRAGKIVLPGRGVKENCNLPSAFGGQIRKNPMGQTKRGRLEGMSPMKDSAGIPIISLE